MAISGDDLTRVDLSRKIWSGEILLQDHFFQKKCSVSEHFFEKNGPVLKILFLSLFVIFLATEHS